MLQKFPEKRGWLPKSATPDGKKVPKEFRPQKVPGWNSDWIKKKELLRTSQFRAKLHAVERKKWKWSHELYGALKLARNDPLEKFRLTENIAKLEGEHSVKGHEHRASFNHDRKQATILASGNESAILAKSGGDESLRAKYKIGGGSDGKTAEMRNREELEAKKRALTTANAPGKLGTGLKRLRKPWEEFESRLKLISSSEVYP
jgi:hypothetical protein